MRDTATQTEPRYEVPVTARDEEWTHASAELLAHVARRSAVSSTLWRYLSTAVYAPLAPASASGRMECVRTSPLTAVALSWAPRNHAERANRDAALLRTTPGCWRACRRVVALDAP